MEREPYQKIADEISEMPVPKYYRLKMDIISKINTGEWTDHTKLSFGKRALQAVRDQPDNSA